MIESLFSGASLMFSWFTHVHPYIHKDTIMYSHKAQVMPILALMKQLNYGDTTKT